MKNKTGVYKIINKVNGKVYYGSTEHSFAIRWNTHKRELRNNEHHCPNLQSAYNKYGYDAFKYIIILLCDPENCRYYEQLFLDRHWDNGKECYNAHKTAIISGREKGFKHPESVKKKIRLAHLGDRNHYNANYGANEPRIELELKIYTEEELIEIERRKKLYGWTWTEKDKQAQSKRLMGKNKGERNGMYGKSIDKIAKEKNRHTLQEKHPHLVKLNWDLIDEIRSKYKTGDYSYRQLAKEYGVAHATIGQILRNQAWMR